MKYTSIAVIYGSDSSEWEVSVRSGEFTSSRVDGQLYDVYEIFARFGQWSVAAYRKRNSMRVVFPKGERPQIDKTDFSAVIDGQKVKFDYVPGMEKCYLELRGTVSHKAKYVDLPSKKVADGANTT